MAMKRWVPLLILIVAAVALRVMLAQGFSPLDESEYARVSLQIANGTFSIADYPGPPVVPVRSGLVLPTAVMFGAFGPSQWTMAAYPLLLSVALLLVVFGMAHVAFGYPAGLLAAGLWAFVPLDALMATWLRPDVPTTAWAFIGVFAVYIGRRKSDSGTAAMAWRGVAAGLAFGAAWLCKESIAYFVPFCGILMAYDLVRDWRRYLPVWAGVAAGSVLVLGAEMAFYAARVGDPLYRLSAMELNYSMYPEFFFAEGSRFGFEPGVSYWKALAKRLVLTGPMAILLEPGFLFLPALGVVATLYGLFWRDERFRFPALLFGSLVVMFNFMSTSFQSYQPLPVFSRYFYSLVPAAAVLVGGMLGCLLFRSEARSTGENREAVFWGGLLSTVMLVVTLYHGVFRPLRDKQPLWTSAEKSLASVLQPDDVIYTDPLSRNGLEFYWRYPATMNITNVNGLADDAIPCDSYVLVNPSYVDWLELNRGMWLTLGGFEAPSTFREPPPEWSEIWANHNARLYEVTCADASL